MLVAFSRTTAFPSTINTCHSHWNINAKAILHPNGSQPTSLPSPNRTCPRREVPSYLGLENDRLMM
jgi:hypothetical protein